MKDDRHDIIWCLDRLTPDTSFVSFSCKDLSQSCLSLSSLFSLRCWMSPGHNSTWDERDLGITSERKLHDKTCSSLPGDDHEKKKKERIQRNTSSLPSLVFFFRFFFTQSLLTSLTEPFLLRISFRLSILSTSSLGLKKKMKVHTSSGLTWDGLSNRDPLSIRLRAREVDYSSLK